MSRIVVLPGMGATGEMYQGPWRELPGVSFPDWPVDSGIGTLDGLAQWMCEQQPDAELFIGSSLGGMVALSCASMMGHARMVLVGSATCFKAVCPLVQKLQPLSHVMPFDWAKLLSGSVPLKLSQMYAKQDAGLMKRLLLDLPNFKWSDDRVQVIRIHGEHDAVIECPPNADLKLNGGHLIAMSHAQEICDWLLGNRFC